MLQATIRLYRNAYSGLPVSVWWLSLVIFVNRMGTMVIPFLTLYITSMGYSKTQAGYVMTVFGTGAIIGAFLGGKLTDKLGFFNVQVFSLIVNGTLLIILGYMPSIISIAVSMFVIGVVGEALRPANSAAVASFSSPENLTRSYSLNRLAINLGWAFGPALGGIISHSSYTMMFWTDGICCISAGVLMYFLFRSANKNRPVRNKEEISSPARSPLKDKVFLWGLFCLFLVAFCFFQLFTILPLFYRQQLLFNNITIGALMAINGVLIALFEMILVYKLEKRSGPVAFMMAGALMVGLSFIVLNILPGLGTALLGILIVTLGEMFLFPFANNFWVNRSSESNRGQYAGLYTMSFSSAFVIAPLLSAMIADNWGFEYLWYLNFAVCSLAAVGYYLLRKKMNDERI